VGRLWCCWTARNLGFHAIRPINSQIDGVVCCTAYVGLAQSGHAGRVARCPLSGVKRTSFAHSEPFHFRPTADKVGIEIPQCSNALGSSPRSGGAASVGR
jgi:hypothetical protein